MNLDIDKPSALLAVVVGLAASLVIDVGTGSRTVEAQEVPASRPAGASGPATRAGCPIASPDERSAAVSPAIAPPAGPPDRQMNPSGTGAAGAGGTVNAQVPGDPCERPKRLLAPRAPAAGGDAAPASTPPRSP